MTNSKEKIPSEGINRTIFHDPFFIDFDKRLVYTPDGKIVRLRPRELFVLLCLTNSHLTWQELTKKIGYYLGLSAYFEGDFVGDKAPQLQFSRENLRGAIDDLRKNLGEEYIENKYGYGYCLRPLSEYRVNLESRA